MSLGFYTGGTTGAADGTLVSSGNKITFAAVDTVVDCHLRFSDDGYSRDGVVMMPSTGAIQISFDGGSTWKAFADNPSSIVTGDGTIGTDIGDLNVAVKLRQHSSASGSTTFTTRTVPASATALATVTGFTATGGTSQVALAWSAVTNRTAYQIDRATDSGFTTGVALDISPGQTGTSFTNTGLTLGTTYYYRIKAIGRIQYANSASYATANAVASPTIDAAILALSPLSYFKTVETSGTALTDSGSLANGATTSGTPTLAQTGPKGLSDAIYMNSGDRIEAPNNSSLRFAGTTSFSVCAWANLDHVTESGVRNFISLDKNDVAYAGWQVSFDTDGKIICYRLNGDIGPTYEGKLSTAVVAAAGWHLYTVTYDGSNWRFYRDDTQIGSAVASTYSVKSATTATLKVGNFASGIGDLPLLGSVCKPAVFGSTLSLAQVQSIALAT